MKEGEIKMLDYIDTAELKKREKIPIKYNVSSIEIECGDWFEYDKFIEKFEAEKAKVLEHEDFKDRPVYTFWLTDEHNYNIYLEFWGERMETDEEFSKRLEEVDEEEKTKEEKILKSLKTQAGILGYDLVKKNPCI